MRTGTTLRAVVLYGDEHQERGDIAVREVGADLAVGLSAGRLPKRPSSVDPNEDGVLGAIGGQSVVMAVVDGHFGFLSSEVALSTLHERIVELLWTAPEDVRGGLDEAVVEVGARVSRAVLAAGSGSATALTVAVVSGGRVHIASVGDTVAVKLSRRGRAILLTRSTPFLGATAPELHAADARLRPGERLILASDGLTDFLGSSWLRSLAEQGGMDAPARGVRRLMEAAHAGGAGDHVAVALHAVPEPVPEL